MTFLQEFIRKVPLEHRWRCNGNMTLHPCREPWRFEILWLHACGKFAPGIALLVRQTPPTVRGMINMYQKGGIQLVTAMDAYHPASDPAQHRNFIISEFQSRPPRKRAVSLPATASLEIWKNIR
ncbi:MAG: hypothetical protein LBQ54_09295 [Planctomycetaceae bacterium]|jgi:hypothetical protein|nr:hypothetical protein [Planctomycetaceae bacterium]